MFRWLMALCLASAALAAENKIPLAPGTKAFLVKVRYRTQDPSLSRLVPADFKVRFHPDTIGFTLTREDRARDALTAATESHALSAGCRSEIRENFLASHPGAVRSVPGTAIILIHPNGVDYRKLELGPDLTLDSLTQLKAVD